MTPPALKPWPTDAFIIVAALAGEEIRANMPEGVLAAECRDCGRSLCASRATFRRAADDPVRMGRPLAYLCRLCVAGHGLVTVRYARDDRPQPKGGGHA